MTAFEQFHKSPDARTLVVSQRLLEPKLSRSTIFELEDSICEFDNADVIAPKRSLMPRWQRFGTRKIRRWTGRNIARHLDPLAGSSPFVDRQYDLTVISTEGLVDLPNLSSLKRWRASSRVLVCYVEELWTRDFSPRLADPIARLGEFDAIFISCQGAVEPLAELTGVPCYYFPPAADALAFCPYPDPPERVIDIYSMGRRSEKTHRALVELSDERQMFYMYDPFVANPWAPSPRDHRRMLINLIQRSRYFTVNSAKMDVPNQTRGQEEIGSRFFEGAAGGAVLLGEIPNAPSFKRLFGWPDAVVRLPYDSANVAEVIDEFESDPGRAEQVRRANVRHSLLHNDWAYHWQALLDAVGVPPLPQLDARIKKMKGLAESLAEKPTVAGS